MNESVMSLPVPTTLLCAHSSSNSELWLMFAHFVGQFDDHMVFSSHSLSQQCNLLS